MPSGSIAALLAAR